MGIGMLAIWEGWDNSFGAAGGEPIAEFARVISPICEQAFRCGRTLQHFGRTDEIMSVPSGDDERARAATLVGQSVDFGRATAA